MQERTTRTDVAGMLHRHDLPFYLHRTKVSEAKQIVAAESGQKITSFCLRKKKGAKPDAECSCFRCLVNQHCNYYLQIRRKPHSTHLDLDDKEWNRLNMFVSNNLHTMNGMSLDDGVEFVKTKISTNQTQLCGLPSRLHFWKSKPVTS